MSAREIAEAVLLGAVVLLCWIAVLGMWRMKEPTQSLHYLFMPSTLGVIFLAAAAFVAQGSSQASWKTFLACALIFISSSVVTHATSRAFRVRQFGHWEPIDGDPIEKVTRDEP